MRITCDTDVTNRLLPSFNIRQKGKTNKSQVSIGKKPSSCPNDDVYLMICTKNDRNGAKYKINNNIQQCFTKFVNEGKATLRFVDPPHDICLSKSDPVQLKSFLSVVKLAFQGKGLDKITLSTLAPASTNIAEKLKTRLTITNRKDYPITTNFPSSLENLSVLGCNLKRFDSRMLLLRNLIVLNLNGNSIKSLPLDLTEVRNLAELHLADNQIEDVPMQFCDSCLKNSLHTLDLSRNKLKMLRPWFCKLNNLSVLKLDGNQLFCLPNQLGTFSRLKTLTVTGNKLRTLPVGFRRLHLDHLDLFGNDFLQDGPNSVIDRLHFPTLLEVTAVTILAKKIAYKEDDVGHLLDFLQSVKYCMCGRPCFRSHVHYLSRVELKEVTASVTALDIHGRTAAPCEAFLCSQRCLDRYRLRPNATLWKD